MQSPLADLEADLRRMMLPNTAMNLKVGDAANRVTLHAQARALASARGNMMA